MSWTKFVQTLNSVAHNFALWHLRAFSISSLKCQFFLGGTFVPITRLPLALLLTVSNWSVVHAFIARHYIILTVFNPSVISAFRAWLYIVPQFLTGLSFLRLAHDVKKSLQKTIIFNSICLNPDLEYSKPTLLLTSSISPLFI